MFSPDYTIQNADIFFETSLYSEDWSLLEDDEKAASLNMAIISVEQNMREEISVIAGRYDETKFLQFLFMQAFYLSQSTDRTINSNGAMAILHISENKQHEVEFIQKKPLSYIWPEALAYIQRVPTLGKLQRG
jgi:hypothetical protein